ncbi:hypothetical protein J2Y56_001921 [Pseudomonas sp. BE134]|jgi:hypothetical protein|nr:hypothetical protein [Pseudomonas sp. BE134]
MSNADLLPSLLFKINQNQLALEAAIMELTLWVEQRGSAEIAGNVRGTGARRTPDSAETRRLKSNAFKLPIHHS